MATCLYIYCPSGEDGAIRCDLEIDIENFFGQAARNVGGGGGEAGFNLDFEFVPWRRGRVMGGSAPGLPPNGRCPGRHLLRSVSGRLEAGPALETCGPQRQR